MPARRLLRVVLAAATSALLSCGCGKGEGPARPRGPDFSTPEAVCTQAFSALEKGDLAALSPFLAEAGAKQVSRDLLAWAAVLRDPATGPRVVARIPPPKTEEEKKDLEKALAGDV